MLKTGSQDLLKIGVPSGPVSGAAEVEAEAVAEAAAAAMLTPALEPEANAAVGVVFTFSLGSAGSFRAGDLDIFDDAVRLL